MMDSRKPRFFAIVTFDTEISLGISDVPNRWHDVRTLVFDNPEDFLLAYSSLDFHEPSVQFTDAPTLPLLKKNIEELKLNVNVPEWQDRFLFPYLA